MNTKKNSIENLIQFPQRISFTPFLLTDTMFNACPKWVRLIWFRMQIDMPSVDGDNSVISNFFERNQVHSAHTFIQFAITHVSSIWWLRSRAIFSFIHDNGTPSCDTESIWNVNFHSEFQEKRDGNLDNLQLAQDCDCEVACTDTYHQNYDSSYQSVKFPFRLEYRQ